MHFLVETVQQEIHLHVMEETPPPVMQEIKVRALRGTIERQRDFALQEIQAPVVHGQ
jgi:hypothetical protein